MRVGSIVIRCYEFDRMLAFWQEALHYVPRAPAEGGWGGATGPFRQRTEHFVGPASRKAQRQKGADFTWTSTRATRKMKLDAYLAGSHWYPWRYRPGDDFVVLADPDDNLFCVVQRSRPSRCEI